MKDRKQFQDLLNRYRNNQCTKHEIHWLQTYIQSGVDQEWIEQEIGSKLLEPVPSAFLQKTEVKEELKEVYKRITLQKKPVTITRDLYSSWLFKAAAGIILISAIGLYTYFAHSGKEPSSLLAEQHHVQPGGNKATLTLADGRTIDLSAGKAGIVINNEDIKYNDGTSLSKIIPSKVSDASTQLTLTTPKGGQYQIILPDSTKVWLNAASSLKYPTSFTGKERRVILNGEAYFEVASVLNKSSGKKLPFIVVSGTQEVEVLGTHFNINAYEDEQATRTTLVEGRVRVTSLLKESSVLSPNQQSVIARNSNLIQVNSVNPESAIAWKNGDFVFRDQNVATAMRQIARWYNVAVDYDDAPLTLKLGGTISRANPLSTVLRAMEATGKIKFNLKGNKLIVKSTKSTNQ